MKRKYDYGSEPINTYDYMCFVKHIAPVLPKDNKVFFHNSSLKWRNNRNGMPLVLFRNICHWKSRRLFRKYLLKNTPDEVDKRWRNALQQLDEPPFQDDAIRGALTELTELQGIGVPMASALLTAWNPDKFGIIDFKVLAVLNLSKSTSIPNYIVFLNRLLKLKKTQPELRNCALRQIELSLWYYYSIQEAGTRERPDNKRY